MANKDLSQDEAAIYDRQIRLWGIEAQQSIGRAHILIAGLRAVASEVAKNLVLAGVGSITILDHTDVTKQAVDSQFFLSDEHVGQNKAEAVAPALQALNPRVNVLIDKEDIHKKADEFFEPFDIVCVFHTDVNLLTRVNDIRHNVSKPFYAADAFGWVGYIFCDLVKHTYIEEKHQTPANKSDEPIVTRTTHVETYQPLCKSLEKNWSTMSAKAIKKRISPIAFLIQILLKYQLKSPQFPSDTEIDELVKDKDIWLQAVGVNDTSVLDDEILKGLSLYQTELPPIAAIIGGVLAQEVIKVLSAKELPVQNWFYYNGYDGSGLIHQLESTE
ncbi:hypothetical protein DM01DRAFT_1298688 [Hesseltinella vesiculosa]|uniref:Ubiquitin-like 1-activating enzyme E1A n=1 Tax=Hesseltinella vesiculosa TaxID=101127 RepID=A0A1X2GVQ8_9FUNG|nr:hypothetical protein DM01DRAFT_1298688 [Hesseltinella vesiculosa]